jgi:hypothetical protein
MKHLSLRRVLALALCICLVVTLLTAFSPTRSAHAATTKATACQTLRYTPGTFSLVITGTANTRKEWTTCAGNTMDLQMQYDGNFVLYLNGHPIWATNTSGLTAIGSYVKFQSDGNIVVHDISTISGPYIAWASHTQNQGATGLSLQSDGNVVIYAASGPIWSTHTNGH